MADYRRISFVLPTDSKWDAEALATKAKNLGMTRNELIVKAVDMFYNYDDEFLKYIKHYSDGLNIPEYLIIQNMIIKQIAKSQAKKKVWGAENRRLEEFIMVEDSKGSRMLTGQELLRALKDMYILNYQK